MDGKRWALSATQGRDLRVIYVSDSQLKQVEYLIQQSLQGHHVLFDNDTLRRVFARRELGTGSTGLEMSTEEAYAVEHHIERMIAAPSLEEKRAYLEKLDRPTFEQVVRTYFNIVENNLYESADLRH